jgi:tellurite methyltransferase
MCDIPRLFDTLYRNAQNYYGTEPSGGLLECIRKYQILPCRALDMGCGGGRNSLWLADHGYDVLAVDVSAEAVRATLAAASTAHLQIRACVCDIAQDTLGGDTFGLIVAVTTLNHVSEQRLHHAYALISDSLVTGGIFYCVVLTTGDPGFSGDAEHASECSHLISHYFQPTELRSAFANLSILEYSEYVKPDTSHGAPHLHAKAKLVAHKR